MTDKGNKLGQWISQQRGIRKGTRKHSIVMDKERIKRLDDIGMDWNPPSFVQKKRNKPKRPQNSMVKTGCNAKNNLEH